MLHHILVIDLYDPIWPNIAASLICAGFLFTKLRSMDRLHKLHHKQAMEQAQVHHAAIMAATATKESP